MFKTRAIVGSVLSIVFLTLSIFVGNAEQSRDRKSMSAALFAAIRSGSVARVRQALSKGADPNAREIVLTKPDLHRGDPGNRETLGETPLIAAANAGKLDAVKLLISRGANVNEQADGGWTPLISAVTSRQPEIAKVLLDHGAKVNQRNDYGDTALTLAANEGMFSLISILLNHGADVNGGTGWTPLMQAAYNGEKDAVILLLKHHADPNVRRGQLMTALECARVQYQNEIAAILIKAGAKGRPLEALKKFNEEAVRQYRNNQVEDKAKQEEQYGTETLTDDDKEVLELTLLDILSCNAKELPFAESNGSMVILVNKTVQGGMVSDDQLNGELDVRQANDVSLEIRKDLEIRNEKPISLEGFRPSSPRIVIGPEMRGAAFYKSGAKCWVQSYLPGYSKAHDRAVVRFRLGPSPHGAAGTYYFARSSGKWHIVWRDFAHYV